MRWKRGILNDLLEIKHHGYTFEFPRGTVVLIGGEDFVANQMLWQVSIGDIKLHLEKEEVTICNTEELTLAKMIFGH